MGKFSFRKNGGNQSGNDVPKQENQPGVSADSVESKQISKSSDVQDDSAGG